MISWEHHGVVNLAEECVYWQAGLCISSIEPLVFVTTVFVICCFINKVFIK
jgi:hypothetical protein